MIIDQLPVLASPTDTDELAIERGQSTYKATRENIVCPYSTSAAVPDEGITISGTATFDIQKCGKVCILRISVNVTNGLTANVYKTLATIPAGFRPRAIVSNFCMLTGTQTAVVVANPAGQVRIAPNATVASGTTASIRALLFWFTE